MSKLPPPKKNMEPKGLHPVKQAELARALGVSRQVVQLHRKNSPDAPKDLNVEEWRKFLAAKGRVESSPKDVLTQIALRKLSILATKDESDKDELAVSRGELIKFVDVSRFLQEVLGVDYWGELDRLSFEMPPNLVGLSAQQMFIEFKREKEKIIVKLREKVVAWVKAQEAKRKCKD